MVRGWTETETKNYFNKFLSYLFSFICIQFNFPLDWKVFYFPTAFISGYLVLSEIAVCWKQEVTRMFSLRSENGVVIVPSSKFQVQKS